MRKLGKTASFAVKMPFGVWFWLIEIDGRFNKCKPDPIPWLIEIDGRFNKCKPDPIPYWLIEIDGRFNKCKPDPIPDYS